jgi:alpha-beta hydrolase superfamily lysophospholipase
MDTERMTLVSASDGLTLHLLAAVPERPKGVFVIVHGMAEHKERYVPLMEYLADLGFASVIQDLRGHGESVRSADDLGYFGTGGMEALLEDLRQVVAYARGRWPGLPLAMLGHSMGSLIARSYLKRYPDLCALILTGSPSFQAAMAPAGLLISCVGRAKGARHRSALIDRAFFGSFNRGIKKPTSRYAWLNSDAAAVEVYDRDPLCGFTFTVDGFATLRRLMMDAYNPNGWAKPPRSVPILFLSGGDDPGMISRVKLTEAASLMRNAGYAHVRVKGCDGLRHEVLNEPRRDQAYAEIASFLTESVDAAERAKG